MRDYPEHKKVSNVMGISQQIGEFMDWIQSSGKVIAQYHKHTGACFDPPMQYAQCGYHEDQLQLSQRSIESLLAEYFKIDLGALAAEKDAMYASISR